MVGAIKSVLSNDLFYFCHEKCCTMEDDGIKLEELYPPLLEDLSREVIFFKAIMETDVL